MEWMFLLVGLASNAGTALSVMPEKYEATQCVELASKYQWPWKAVCVPAPKLSIMKEEKLGDTGLTCVRIVGEPPNARLVNYPCDRKIKWLAPDGVNTCTDDGRMTSCTLLHVEKTK